MPGASFDREREREEKVRRERREKKESQSGETGEREIVREKEEREA